MLLVATLSLDSAAGPVQDLEYAVRRTTATLAKLARLHELVIVADWPDRGWTVRSLVDSLTSALPWHEVVLVAARTDTHGRHAGGISNVQTVRRLVEDGALVICLAGGPGRDRTEPVALALASALHADRVIRLTDDGSGAGAGDRHHDVQVTRSPSIPRRRMPSLSTPAARAPSAAQAPGVIPAPGVIQTPGVVPGACSPGAPNPAGCQVRHTAPG